MFFVWFKTKTRLSIFNRISGLVPREGIEPSWGYPRTILSRVRLPVPPPRLIVTLVTAYFNHLETVLSKGGPSCTVYVVMACIIAVVNQKGGVGKTTTAINLGSYLASNGKFVLLVDLDPQSNATSGLGIDSRDLEVGTYEILLGEKSLRDVIIPTQVEGLKLAPSTQALAGAAVDLVDMDRREHRLSDALLEVRNDFDYIIIDCPPSLGLLTINGLVAVDKVLIPVQAEYYALEGLSQLLRTIGMVRQALKPELEILGAVLTMYDGRNRLSTDVMAELHRFFPDRVFKSVIPRNVRLAEAPSFGRPIMEYDPWSKGAKAYERLAKEILDLEHSF